eukprot:jgi/Chrzof1/2161/Cz11g04160.t1
MAPPITWQQAKKVLARLYPDRHQYGHVLGELLKRSEAERLELFQYEESQAEGSGFILLDDTAVKAALDALASIGKCPLMQRRLWLGCGFQSTHSM